MWLLAATSLHWLKHTPKTCSKTSLCCGELQLVHQYSYWIHLPVRCSVTLPPGPETHVGYIDLCDYIFQITACFPCILVYCHFRCMTTQVQERGSVTRLTQCTCQTSAVTPLFFSVALLLTSHPLTFQMRPSSLCLHIDSVSSMLLSACLQWSRVRLPNCNTAPWWHSRALQVGTLQFVPFEKLQTSI